MEKTPRKRRNFSDDFKQHVVDLYQEGMGRKEIIEKYALTPSAFDRWVQQYRKSGSFKASDSMSDIEKELVALRKEYQRLKTEHDILKEAARILAEKDDM